MLQDVFSCRTMSENMPEKATMRECRPPHPVPHLQVVQRVMRSAKKETLCWLQELKALREGENKGAGVLLHHQESGSVRSHSRKARGFKQQIVRKYPNRECYEEQ